MKGFFACLLAVCMACLVLGCSDPGSGPALGDFPAITKSLTDAPFTITAPTSRSPAAFSFSSSNEAVATISGTTVTIKGAGSSTITASQPSLGSYGPTSKSTTLTVSGVSCETGNVLVNGVCTPAANCVSPATIVNNQCVAPASSATSFPSGSLIWVGVTFTGTWTQARDFCANSVIDNVGSWRQPTQVELANLVSSGVIAGKNWVRDDTWTSTAGTDSATHVVVNLNTNVAAPRGDAMNAYVSCVKGG
jgi:hypothetical protein